MQNLWQKIHRCPFLIGQGKFLRSQNQEKARVYCFGNQDRLITKMVWDGLGGARDHWRTWPHRIAKKCQVQLTVISIAELSVQPSSAWNTPQWRHFIFSSVRYPTLIWHYLTWHLLAVAGLTRAVPSPIGLFSVVQFPNDACDTTDATPLTGTCLTSTECTGRSVLASQGMIILYIVLQLQSFRLQPD